MPKVANLWLIGDSTMADYANYGEDYMIERYPQTGWGQALQIRYLDKLVDELAKGKVMEKILRK